MNKFCEMIITKIRKYDSNISMPAEKSLDERVGFGKKNNACF